MSGSGGSTAQVGSHRVCELKYVPVHHSKGQQPLVRSLWQDRFVRRMVIAGDWHGDLQHATFVVDRASFQGIDTVLQVGDFGFGWPGDDPRLLQRLSRRLVKRGVHLLFIRGNHDNTVWLDELDRDEDGLANAVPHVRYVPDGARFMVNGVRFGALGGARSVDRDLRTEGRDWWPGEEARPSDLERLGHDPLEILVTHEAPGLIPMVPPGHSQPAIPDGTRRLIDEAIERTRVRAVFHGHWHRRATSEILLPEGRRVRVEGLGMNGLADGDSVILDLQTLEVRPLPARTSP